MRVSQPPQGDAIDTTGLQVTCCNDMDFMHASSMSFRQESYRIRQLADVWYSYRSEDSTWTYTRVFAI